MSCISVLVSCAVDIAWLTYTTELYGGAEFEWPYDEEGNIKTPDKVEVPSGSAHYEATPVESLSSEGLSVFTKLFLFAIIVGVCFAYVKAHSPGRTTHAGRHGAYEKGGLP